MAIVRIQLRRDTAADWTSANPVLAEGEMGIETDTDQFKIGDGATAWNSLGYGGLQGADGLPGIVASDVAPVDTDVIWLDTDDPLEPLVVPGGGTTGQVLSKASGDNYDTEWATVDLSTKQDDVITTQGDLVIGDGSGDASRIAIGAADTVLTSNGTTATWAAAGGAGDWTLLDEANLTPAPGTRTITVTGLGGYDNYIVHITGFRMSIGTQLSIDFGGSALYLVLERPANSSDPSMYFRNNGNVTLAYDDFGGITLEGTIRIWNGSSTGIKPINAMGGSGSNLRYYFEQGWVDNNSLPIDQIVIKGGQDIDFCNYKIYGA